MSIAQSHAGLVYWAIIWSDSWRRTSCSLALPAVPGRESRCGVRAQAWFLLHHGGNMHLALIHTWQKYIWLHSGTNSGTLIHYYMCLKEDSRFMKQQDYLFMSCFVQKQQDYLFMFCSVQEATFLFTLKCHYHSSCSKISTRIKNEWNVSPPVFIERRAPGVGSDSCFEEGAGSLHRSLHHPTLPPAVAGTGAAGIC